jgi:MoaA/NifB/PqqE/SkfB family radical SAM enzyme
LDLLKVSIDGADRETYRAIRGVDFLPRVLDNVREINEIKKRLGVQTPFIRFQFVVQKANYREAADVVRLAHRSGVQAVFFKPLEIARIEERVDHLIGGIELESLKASLGEARDAARELGVSTNLDDFIHYLLPNHWQIYKRDRTFRPLAKQCIIPWFSVVVRIHGDVGFCCYAKIEDAKVGNIFEEGFEAVWQGKRYREMRGMLRRGGMPLPKCAFCVPQRLSHLFNYRKVIPGYRG